MTRHTRLTFLFGLLWIIAFVIAASYVARLPL